MRNPSPDADVSERGIREMSDSVTRGVLVSDPAPTMTELQALLEVETGPAPRVWVDAGARALESLVIARTRLDDIDAALALIETHFADGRLRVRAVIAAGTRSTLLSAVAEAYAAAGWPRRAGLYATAALAYADSPDVRYRAEAVRALSYALNGEVAAAREAIDRCADIVDERVAPLHPDYALLLAEILVASAALDASRLRRIAGDLREHARSDPHWTYTARCAEAMAALVAREYVDGLALLETLVGGADSLYSHAMVRGMALGVLADTLLARGESRRALALLEDVASPAEHALCFEMQRSSAHLALGRQREVLEATDACIAMGRAHCLRTLTPLHIRRAIAHLRLGNPGAARSSFEEAFRLGISLGGSLTPYLTLPREELGILLDDVVAHHPGWAEAAEDIRDRLYRVPTNDTPRLALTPREERLAALLRSPRTVAQMADELRVSVNTVKTQLRSIYAKLRVSTRADAVAALEAYGFFV